MNFPTIYKVVWLSILQVISSLIIAFTPQETWWTARISNFHMQFPFQSSNLHLDWSCLILLAVEQKRKKEIQKAHDTKLVMNEVGYVIDVNARE